MSPSRWFRFLGLTIAHLLPSISFWAFAARLVGQEPFQRGPSPSNRHQYRHSDPKALSYLSSPFLCSSRSDSYCHSRYLYASVIFICDSAQHCCFHNLFQLVSFTSCLQYQIFHAFFSSFSIVAYASFSHGCPTIHPLLSSYDVSVSYSLW